jgi:CHAT domain-containing protein
MGESFLALAGGHLLAYDAKRYSLEQHPLVVMSACQTGLGKIFEGGTFGLARAWHYAGASKVVMSLWNVDDSSTEFTMVEFMKGIKAGRATEDALWDAMKEARRKYPDPEYWAPFSLFGQPTTRSTER